MSLVEYYVTADYYEKLKEEDIEKIDKENELVYYIDFGSAAEIGLMYMLKELNRFKSIESVVVTSFVE